MADVQTTPVIRCASCGAANRVPAERLREGLVPVCGRCKVPLGVDGKPRVVTDATFAVEVEQSPLPVALDVWAPWCGPCRMMEPVIDSLASQMAGRVRFAKLNVDENPQTAARFGISGIPTLIIFEGGREIDRLVGVQRDADISRRLESLLT